MIKCIILGNELMKESERQSLMGICLHFSITPLFICNNGLGYGRVVGVKGDMGQILH